jgi:hypothetical protein
MTADHTRPTDKTRASEQRAAHAEHAPDREPTPDEEQVADGLRPDGAVAERHKEMQERGAGQQGEGRLPG